MGQNATVGTAAPATRYGADRRRTGTVEGHVAKGAEWDALPYRRPTSVPVALLIGFVAGSVFWHFMGFWDFVGRIVFHKPKMVPAISGPQRSGDLGAKSPEQLASGAMTATDTAGIARDAVDVSGDVPATVAQCTTLVRDPATGLTSTTGCAFGSVPERFGVALRRGDFARVAEADRSRPNDKIPEAVPARGSVPGWSTVTSRTP